MQNLTPAITINDHSILIDAEGRYRLNDLHKASGGEKRHAPSEWTKINQASELVSELNSGNNPSLALVSIEGRNGGTYACKELVYAYATWISPAFFLHVIRTFDAVVSGVQSKASAPAPLSDSLLLIETAARMMNMSDSGKLAMLGAPD